MTDTAGWNKLTAEEVTAKAIKEHGPEVGALVAAAINGEGVVGTRPRGKRPIKEGSGKEGAVQAPSGQRTLLHDPGRSVRLGSGERPHSGEG